MIKTLGAQIKEFKKASLVTPVFMIAEVIMETIIPLLMASIIDDGVNQGDMKHIYMIGGLMILAALLSLTFGIGGGVFGAKASTGFARNLRKAMYEKIQTFSFANIDKFSTSGLVTRLTTDVTNIQNAYQMILRMCMRAPISLICAMAMSFYISARLASVYLVAVIVLGAILAVIVSRAMKHFNEAFPKYDDLNESVQENVSAIRVVKAYVREDYENQKFKKASGNIYKIFCKAEGIVAWNSPVMNLTVYTCILLISWLGAHMIVQNTLTTGQLMSLLTYCMNILMNLMMLSMIFVMMTMSAASARRVCEVLTEEPDLKNPENPVFEVKDGSICFDHVSFSYKKDAKTPVLKNINLDIHSGETIGIIGGTGSAKSSLVNLVSRLYDVTEGRLLVGGRDVREYDMEVLRNQVAVVLQNNVLFSGTILDNLRWGDKEAAEEECKRACELACADEFIQKMPEGYHTYIEQGGTNVSGGQKQRLSIARAIAKDPEIFIFDDSFSALDFKTDSTLRKALKEHTKEATTIIVAQRISTILNADKILVLDDGHMAGIGSHKELMKSCEVYRQIAMSQLSEEELA